MFERIHLLEINLSGETITDKNYLALGQLPFFARHPLLKTKNPIRHVSDNSIQYRILPYRTNQIFTGASDDC